LLNFDIWGISCATILMAENPIEFDYTWIRPADCVEYTKVLG